MSSDVMYPESLKQKLLDIHRIHSMQCASTHTSDHRKRRNRNSVKPSVVEQAYLDTSYTDVLLQGNVAMDAENSHKYNSQAFLKDYIKMARDYKRMGQFRVPSNDEDITRYPSCVLCLKRGRKIEKVFFPCEHKCVCSVCLERKIPTQCPLCNEVVRVVLDHTGHENEEYWSWVEEVSLCSSKVSRFFSFYKK